MFAPGALIHRCREKGSTHVWVSMSLRPSRIPPPDEDDVRLALQGDPAARRRVKQQRFRANKRKLEISKYDVTEEAR